MKLGLFTDAHYSSISGPTVLERIEKAFKAFQKAKCDLVVFLGDLLHDDVSHEREIENLKAIGRIFCGFDGCAFAVIGNHDTNLFTKDAFYQILGEQFRPRSLVLDGKCFLFIDGCYFQSGEEYRPGHTGGVDTWYPHADALERDLGQMEGELAYIFTHQVLDLSSGSVQRILNAADIRGILEKSGKVRTVFQGHSHRLVESDINGIHYMTLPAMHDRENAYYILDL